MLPLTNDVMMKILWLSHLIPYPPKAGVLIRSYNLLKQVAAQNDVVLAAFSQRALMGSFFDDVDEGVEIARSELESFCTEVCFFEIPSEKLSQGQAILAAKSLFTKDCYTINWLKSREYSDFVRSQVESGGFDLALFDTISLAPYLDDVRGIPTVLDHHNIESHMMLRRAERESNWLRSAYFSQEGRRLGDYEKRVCPQFDLSITCSDLDTERLANIDPSLAIKTIENGVDLEFFKPQGSAGMDQSIIFVGTMNWYPNIEAVRFLISEIWPTLKLEAPDATIDIVGANPPEELVGLATNEPNVHFHGFVDDILTMLDKATVYVCPITDGGGTKLKLLDAFAMEKAVVCDPVACEGIAAKDGESVLFADTSDAYVKHILSLFEDANLRRRLGAEARKLVQSRYSFDAIGERLNDSFRSIVEGKSERSAKN